MTDRTREAYITGLRQLADTLAAHGELPLPYSGTSSPIHFFLLHGEDPKAEMAAAARLLPCSFRKKGTDDYFHLIGKLAGLEVQLTAYRSEVCERVVIGTHEVTVEEHDPEALAAVPKVTKTVTVEDVEWVCSPILAPAAESAVA